MVGSQKLTLFTALVMLHHVLVVIIYFTLLLFLMQAFSMSSKFTKEAL